MRLILNKIQKSVNDQNQLYTGKFQKKKMSFILKKRDLNYLLKRAYRACEVEASMLGENLQKLNFERFSSSSYHWRPNSHQWYVPASGHLDPKWISLLWRIDHRSN